MIDTDQEKSTIRPAGYAALIEWYDLDVISNWHTSRVTTSGIHRVDSQAGATDEVYPPHYWPGDDLGDHLEFALKYDGTNLAILARLFQEQVEEELLKYIHSKPTGKCARRLWFFYEFLTGKTLPLNDLKRGNYIDLLEPDEYYTITSARRIRRQRVYDNLLGDIRFCPTVRRTDTLEESESSDLPSRCKQIISRYPQELLRRALSYLYTKETKSSFAIEQNNPSPTRTERFNSLLRVAEQEDFCRKQLLIELQNYIVDDRFRDADYRQTQNYLGETVAWQSERVRFACPKPDDLIDSMDGLVAAHRCMESGDTSAVVHAAAIAYGFVYLHPFEDGNGRIHRFLIHNILARRGFTPPGVIVPVSAAMLKSSVDYDGSLEAFSSNLMPLVDYTLDDEGYMTVHSETANWYRYIDMTQQVEALFHLLARAIVTEFADELAFLYNYDAVKSSLKEVVDMPDRHIDLFIRFCLQNNGRLSKRKRKSHFELLTDDEIEAMEEAVLSAYGDGSMQESQSTTGRSTFEGSCIQPSRRRRQGSLAASGP